MPQGSPAISVIASLPNGPPNFLRYGSDILEHGSTQQALADRSIGWGHTAILTGRSSPMTMHSDNKGRGLINNLWVQMAILAIVIIVLIALAAKYLW